MKIIARLLLILFFLTFCALIAVSFDLFLYARQSTTPKKSETVISILPGQRLRETAAILHQKRIIQSPAKFKLLARINGLDKKIKAGEYLFAGALSPIEILSIMAAGKVVLYKLTIPEGYTLHQIAAVVQQAGLASKDAFLQAAFDAHLTRKLGIEADSFEGYCFPETYFFAKTAGAEKIIAKMVQRFFSVFTPELQAAARGRGLSVHEAVTLASIIERETGAPFERKLISSVFHNRLKKGMRLESDPTVIYGIPDFNGNLTRKHLRTHTPYNTYLIKGLPPGPIANPGLMAIEAALFPAESRYLYFVSKKDRTHQFSTNLKDHNQAVRTYQLKR